MLSLLFWIPVTTCAVSCPCAAHDEPPVASCVRHRYMKNRCPVAWPDLIFSIPPLDGRRFTVYREISLNEDAFLSALSLASLEECPGVSNRIGKLCDTGSLSVTRSR